MNSKAYYTRPVRNVSCSERKDKKIVYQQALYVNSRSSTKAKKKVQTSLNYVVCKQRRKEINKNVRKEIKVEKRLNLEENNQMEVDF